MNEVQQAAERLTADGEKYDYIYWDGNGKYHPEADANLVAKAYLAEHDDTPITEQWLEHVGFAIGGLCATILVPPTHDGAAIVELGITGTETANGDEWDISLLQGVPDDQHYEDDHVTLTSLPRALTRGDVRRLCAALGIDLKERT